MLKTVTENVLYFFDIFIFSGVNPNVAYESETCTKKYIKGSKILIKKNNNDPENNISKGKDA